MLQAPVPRKGVNRALLWAAAGLALLLGMLVPALGGQIVRAVWVTANGVTFIALAGKWHADPAGRCSGTVHE